MQCANLKRDDGAVWKPSGQPVEGWTGVAGVAHDCAWYPDGHVACRVPPTCAGVSVVLRGVGDANAQRGRSCVNLSDDASIVCVDPIACASPERLTDVVDATSAGQLCARERNGSVVCADRNAPVSYRSRARRGRSRFAEPTGKRARSYRTAACAAGRPAIGGSKTTPARKHVCAPRKQEGGVLGMHDDAALRSWCDERPDPPGAGERATGMWNVRRGRVGALARGRACPPTRRRKIG